MQTFWFATLGVFLAGYLVLDGFDLGVGILHPFAKGDDERRLLLNAIGPVWIGNAAWLFAFVASFFAAFPDAYATLFSGFYVPFMLLLLALVLRAASIEFRGKHPSPAWRRLWDAVFFGSSLLTALLIGVAAGNLVAGVPVDSEGLLAADLGDLLGPFPLLTGLLTAAMFAMHGASYLCLKTEGALQARCRAWKVRSLLAFIVLYVAALALTLGQESVTSRRMMDRPWMWVVAGAGVLVAGGVWRLHRKERLAQAFAGSCALIGVTLALFCGLLYPDLVPSSLDESWSLHIWNSCSSDRTLAALRVLALLGIPLALAYTAFAYRVFRGKVRLGDSSY